MSNSQMLPAVSGTQFVEVVDQVPQAQAPAQAPAQNPLMVAHALLSGRYKLACSLSVIGAILGAAIGYFAVPPTYRSTGMIQVHPNLQKILYQTEQNGLMPMFDAFVESQVQLISSQRVIDLAMQRAEWKKFGRELSDKKIAEFGISLEVVHPKNSELIVVAFSDRDPAAAASAVTAVIRAYYERFGHSDQESGARRMEQLENWRNDLDDQLNSRKIAIQRIANEFGSDSLQQNLDRKLAEVDSLDGELWRAQLAVAAAGGGFSGSKDTAATTTAPAAGGRAPRATSTTSPAEVGPARTFDPSVAMNDPVLNQLRTQQQQAQRQVDTLGVRLGIDHPEMQTAQAMLVSIQRSITERTEELRRAYFTVGSLGSSGPLASTIVPSLDRLRDTEELTRRRVEKVRAEAIELGRKNLMIENLRQEADGISIRLTEANSRIEALTLEQKNVGGRIEILSEGEPPRLPEKDRRPALAAVGSTGLASLGVGVVMLIGLADRRLRRISDAAAHVRRGARILGVLPALNDVAVDIAEATLAAHCVHHIRALLQARRDGSTPPAFVITSPSPGDGKTTLSIALGMSYAACGSATLLIDLDLHGGGLTARMSRAAHRKLGRILVQRGRITMPMLNAALSECRTSKRKLGELLREHGHITADDLEEALREQPQTSLGLWDVLNGEALVNCVASAGLPRLFVLPLGAAGREHVAQLSPEVVTRVIDEARRHFQTVLIDTGPILGSLEASMAGTVANGVIVTVSRGGDKTLARRALEYLNSVGAPVEGIVFNRAEAIDLAGSPFSSSVTRSSQAPLIASESSRLNPPFEAAAQSQSSDA